MSPRVALLLLGFLLIPEPQAADRIERRVEVLAAARTAKASSELRFESGTSLALSLDKVEVIDLQHPARPARRSLKLAPAGSGVVLDLRRDESGNLRFGRIFLAPDRARAERFLANEFRTSTTSQEVK